MSAMITLQVATVEEKLCIPANILKSWIRQIPRQNIIVNLKGDFRSTFTVFSNERTSLYHLKNKK